MTLRDGGAAILIDTECILHSCATWLWQHGQQGAQIILQTMTHASHVIVIVAACFVAACAAWP